MAKKTVWDISLEIAGKDTGASAAIRRVQREMKNVQDAGKQLGKDFKSFTSNATKLAVGVVGGVAAATAGVVAMANSFAETGDKVAKTSAAIGIGIEAYQELQYAMGQSGLSAEEFDGALQKFNLTVRQGAAGNAAAARQLEEVGLSAQKLAGLKPEQAMERLSDYMKALPSDAERTRVAVTLFGKSAGPKMMAAMKQGSAGLRDLMGEARSLGIVMSEEQAHQSESYMSAISRLKSSVTGMKNQFIGGAIGPLTEAFDHLKSAIVEQMPAISELGNKFGLWLGDMVQRLPEIIAKIKEFASNVWNNVNTVKEFLGGWKNVAKIIGLLVIAPTFISGIKVVISLFSVMKAVVGLASGVMGLFGTSAGAAGAAAAAGGAAGATGFGALAAAVWAATWPVLAVIAAIAALIAIIVLVVKNFDKIKEVAGKVWGAVKEGATKAWNTVKEGASKAWEGIKSGAGKVGGWLKNNWKSVGIGMVNPVAGAFKYMYDNCEGFRNVVDKVGNFVKGIFSKVFNFLNNLTGGALGRIVDKFKGFVESVKQFFSGLWSAIKEGPRATIAYLGNAFGNLWNGIKNIAGAAWEGIKNAAGKAWDGIKGAAGSAWEGMKNAGAASAEFFKNRWNDIKNAGGQAFNFIDNFSGGALTRMKDNFLNGINNIKEFFAGLWGAVKEGPAATIEYLKNAFFGLFDSIKQKIEAFVNFFKEKMEAVKNFFGGIGDKVGGLVGGAVDKFKSFLPGHAEGGIFTHRHIAEIAERGAEAVVPLNNSPQGFDIWKQAGELGGYISKMNQQTATASTSGAPPVMQAAAQRISGGENIIDVNFSQNNTFNGGTDKETVNQISAAGREAADDFEVRVKQALDNIMRNQRRVSFA